MMKFFNNYFWVYEILWIKSKTKNARNTGPLCNQKVKLTIKIDSSLSNKKYIFI